MGNCVENLIQRLVARQQRILVIEDDHALRALLVRIVSLAAPGSTIDDTSAGDLGVALVAEAGYDLIVTDLGLPGADGTEVIRAARRLDPPVPVVVVTAETDPRRRDDARAAGAHEVFAKPFDPPVLIAALRRIIASGEEP